MLTLYPEPQRNENIMKTKAAVVRPSDAALETLRYWHCSNTVAVYGDDAADHDGPAYDGMRECYDARWITHVPSTDTYQLTSSGLRILGNY